MARRALVLRPDYAALSGFANSAACLAQLLIARGFAVTRCEDGDATRAGILGAYDDLIERTQPGDAVVVAYVGHGRLTSNDAYAPGDDLPRYFQCICPSDFAATTDHDFRGVSSWELSLRLARLTARTANVTLILECCYAAQLARGETASAAPPAAAASPTLTRVGLTAHLQALRDGAGAPDAFAALELTGSSQAVRIAACSQTGSAYQSQLPSADGLRALGLDLPAGGWIGGMTLRLAEILAEVGDAPVSWRSIAGALRHRLAVQRPEIEGPITRVPFSLDTVDADLFRVRRDGDAAIVEAGRVLGVARGDVYGVMPAGSTRIEPGALLAELTIDEVSAMTSRSRPIAWRGEARTLPADAVAIAMSRALERLVVAIVAGDADRATIAAALQRSARVRAAQPGEHDAIAELHVRAGRLELCDALGPLFPPAPFPRCLPDAVADLENLATACHLRAMATDQGLAPHSVTVELVVLGATGSRTLADHGEAIGLGDRIALRFENRGAAPVFAHVFNIGLRRRIARLSAAAASGLELPPHEPTYLGDRLDGRLEGFALHWPDGLPRDQPRLDTLLVLITDHPADLSMLETREHLGHAYRTGLTPLQHLLEQLATGRVRSAAPGGPAGFAMHWLDYELVPCDAALGFAAPEDVAAARRRA